MRIWFVIIGLAVTGLSLAVPAKATAMSECVPDEIRGVLSVEEAANQIAQQLLDQSRGPYSTKWVITPPEPIGSISPSLMDDLAATLTNELVRSGRVTILERALLDKLLEEANLTNEDLFAYDAGPKMGKLLGASVVLVGSVARLNAEELRISYRTVEAKTGRIIAAAAVTARDPASPQHSPIKCATLVVGYGDDDFASTTIGLGGKKYSIKQGEKRRFSVLENQSHEITHYGPEGYKQFCCAYNSREVLLGPEEERTILLDFERAHTKKETYWGAVVLAPITPWGASYLVKDADKAGVTNMVLSGVKFLGFGLMILAVNGEDKSKGDGVKVIEDPQRRKKLTRIALAGMAAVHGVQMTIVWGAAIKHWKASVSGYIGAFR